ncbi:MAG: rhomboid family intramembrane serine protease [Syntrophales bacterium]|nr:rhomboid family intramembrane serine protease [Syntrophales bacterium]MDD5642331.1 rhomboid family intramembrane serine protease [Syntrophales bacterium]
MIPIRGAAGNSWPWVTLGLIALNVAVYLYQLHLGPQGESTLFLQGGAVAAKLSQVKLLSSRQSLWILATMFSSLFLHGGWVHLLGNMWFLWLFGEALEADLGHLRFLGFYLFSGFFSCLFHVLAASTLDAPLIGASGAIAGVLGGYLVRLPKAPIRTLVFWRLKAEIKEIPAFFWLGLWLALQFYGLRQGGTVAWVAHLGGFAIGVLTVNLFTPVSPGTEQPKPARKKGKTVKTKAIKAKPVKAKKRA